MSSTRKLAIAQSGGPTRVVNASLAGAIQAAQTSNGFSHVVGLRHALEGALANDIINLEGVGLDALAATPGAALGSSRKRLDDDAFTQVVNNFQQNGITDFAYIGGNGSMFVCNKLAEIAAASGVDLRVMGVPKTVDNDLHGTHFCPGYGSAARFMALAVRDTGLDQEAMVTFEDVTVFEAMGRDAGWLAAAGALLKQTADEAPHLVYVPEIVFDEARFMDDVARIHARLGRVYVVVGEGLHDADGGFVGVTDAQTDNMGRTMYTFSSGVAAYLAGQVRDKLNLTARFIRSSIIGRALSDSVSSVDRQAAMTVGAAAVTHFLNGESDLMVTLNAPENDTVTTGVLPLTDVYRKTRHLPPEFIHEDGNMVTQAFMDYGLPLIGDVSPVLRL